ncbi:MAG TPA: discoidin domain-containing protein, partial [Phycisphaerae bacterium]|nr:discoidin domain-containing protein [Phycisphaerae bacterium]
LAIATALRPPGTGNRGAGGQEKPDDPLDRYMHFKKAHKNKELVPSFDNLTAWELTHVVSSCASDKDLAWGREMVRTFIPDLLKGERVVSMTSQMVYQGSQIPYHDFSCVLAGGGKCGPRSSFGVFINQAFGIPAIGVGQPGHAAVAWRGPDGTWQIGYGRGWNVSKLFDRYKMSGAEFLERAAERRGPTFAQVEHLRWLASALASKEQAAAVMEVARKIQKAPPVVTASLRERPSPPKERDPPSEPPIQVAPGVIHVEAEKFFTRGGVHFYGGQHPSVPVIDCYTGGKQLHFQALMGEANVGYKINVPATGIYELTARVATVNWGQNLYVRSFGAMLPVKEAKASAVYHNMVKDLGPQQAVDNDLGTRWAVNEGVDQAWLELDLGRPTTISTVMIDERTWNRVSKFLVEYKVGNNWKTIFEGTNIGIGFHKSFSPVTARNVRLRTLDCRDAGGPTIWEFSVGTVNDGDAWINTEWTKGLWQTTKPVNIRLVKGAQTLWFCAPYQRGISFKWFELKPKTINRGISSLSPPSQIKNP